MNRYVPNQDLKIDVLRVGHSRETVLVIDDFLTDPSPLIDAASRSKDWRDLPPGGYPGRRAGLPSDYVRSVLRRLDGPVRQHLVRENAKLDRFECAFSMVTKAPAELKQLQRVPHIDIARENRVAILHYLCGPDFGGTAFFRQISTGFEQIGPDQRAEYIAARARDVSSLTPCHLYPDENTPGYERTGYTEAKFNRLVAYRSFTLHSGIIDAPEALTDDPKTGRLTANFFVDYAPATG